MTRSSRRCARPSAGWSASRTPTSRTAVVRSPRIPASTSCCGRGSPRWACSAFPSPRSTAAWARVPSRSGSSRRSWAGCSHPSRSSRRSCSPVASSLRPAPTSSARRCSGQLAAGELVLAFAHAEPRTRWAATASAVTATRSGDDWALSGVKEPVPHGARADLLVVSALLDSGDTGLFLVAGDASGLTRSGYATHDGGRAARIAFASTPAVPLGEAGADATDAIASALDGARIAAGLEAVGAMQFALDATSEYLTDPQAVRRAAQDLPGADVPGRGHVRLPGARAQRGAVGDDGARLGLRGPGARRGLAVGPPGQPGRAAHRPGGDPAARRHRDDGGVQRGQLHRATSPRSTTCWATDSSTCPSSRRRSGSTPRSTRSRDSPLRGPPARSDYPRPAVRPIIADLVAGARGPLHTEFQIAPEVGAGHQTYPEGDACSRPTRPRPRSCPPAHRPHGCWRSPRTAPTSS